MSAVGWPAARCEGNGGGAIALGHRAITDIPTVNIIAPSSLKGTSSMKLLLLACFTLIACKKEPSSPAAAVGGAGDGVGA
jgi:hypothetical protein